MSAHNDVTTDVSTTNKQRNIEPACVADDDRAAVFEAAASSSKLRRIICRVLASLLAAFVSGSVRGSASHLALVVAISRSPIDRLFADCAPLCEVTGWGRALI